MKKLLLIALLIVGCDSPTGSSTDAVGTYTMTTYIGYDTSNCSGQGNDGLAANPDVSITLILNANGDATMIGESDEIAEPDYDYGSWTQSDNQVTLLFFDDLVTFTLSGNTLSTQMSYESDSVGGYCNYIIFTKQ
tara:strand:+ start:601 stop:1005 length:405 start_codon:yes stop_codon:yes gene_type:complete